MNKQATIGIFLIFATIGILIAASAAINKMDTKFDQK